MTSPAGVSATVQVRISGAKGEPDAVAGPDDATVVVRVARADAGDDPAVSYMQGRLKAEGHTGVLFDALADGTVSRLVQEALSSTPR